MDSVKRIRQILEERNWSEYKLAKQSGLSQSTITNMFKRNTAPTIPTLEAICKGLGLTLSQFFAESDESVKLTNEQKEMFEKWRTLTNEQKRILLELIKTMK